MVSWFFLWLGPVGPSRPRPTPAPGVVARAALRRRRADALGRPSARRLLGAAALHLRHGGHGPLGDRIEAPSSSPSWPPRSTTAVWIALATRRGRSLRRGASRPQRIQELEVRGDRAHQLAARLRGEDRRRHPRRRGPDCRRRCRRAPALRPRAPHAPRQGGERIPEGSGGRSTSRSATTSTSGCSRRESRSWSATSAPSGA